MTIESISMDSVHTAVGTCGGRGLGAALKAQARPLMVLLYAEE